MTSISTPQLVQIDFSNALFFFIDYIQIDFRLFFFTCVMSTSINKFLDMITLILRIGNLTDKNNYMKRYIKN